MTTEVKCVVWDLDGTLCSGVLLEATGPAGTRMQPRPGIREVLAELHARGIVHSIASRNPPRLAAEAVAAADWPVPFVAPQYGWGAKSGSLRRIAETLGVRASGLAFVDDDPYERAEVAAALPEVLVLSPEEVAGALQWPQFRPAVATAEGRRRARSYLAAEQRRSAEEWAGGSRAEFRRYCRTTVTLRPAVQTDLPRLCELSARTSQFNSRGGAMPEPDLARRLASARHRTACVELRDRFHDDGTVGAAVVATGPEGWVAELLMMSCRAIGRGAIEALLAGLVHAAGRARAAELRVPVLASERNLPLRLALKAAGFRAAAGHSGQVIEFGRAVAGAPLPYPAGITVVSEL